MSREQRYPDTIAARVEVLGEIAQRLRSVPATVDEENRRSIGPASKLEAFRSRYEPVVSDRESLRCLVTEPQGRPTRQGEGGDQDDDGNPQKQSQHLTSESRDDRCA